MNFILEVFMVVAVLVFQMVPGNSAQSNCPAGKRSFGPPIQGECPKGYTLTVNSCCPSGKAQCPTGTIDVGAIGGLCLIGGTAVGDACCAPNYDGSCPTGTNFIGMTTNGVCPTAGAIRSGAFCCLSGNVPITGNCPAGTSVFGPSYGGQCPTGSQAVGGVCCISG